jgi:RNA polymerase sigma-70 factor, ECF subfamily
VSFLHVLAAMESTAKAVTKEGLAALVEAARSGSRGALEQLFTYCLPILSAEVKKYVSPADVDDVVQESLVKIFQSLGRYHEEGQFPAWVKKVGVRTSIDHWRKAKRFRLSKEDYEREGPSATTEIGGDVLLRKRLEQCLSTLSPEDRILCTMVFLDEQTHKHAAEVLGRSVVYVKVRCFRLRAKLQKCFEDG